MLFNESRDEVIAERVSNLEEQVIMQNLERKHE
jgi:hypothetical protein